MVADAVGTLHKTFFFDHIQDCVCDGAGDRVSTIRVEIFHSSVGETFRDFGCSDNSGNGVAIAHRFAHSNDVGHDVLRLKRPHVSADTAESDLDFIRYAHTVSFANMLEYSFEVAIRRNNLTSTALKTFRDKCTNTAIFAFTFLADLADLVSVKFP